MVGVFHNYFDGVGVVPMIILSSFRARLAATERDLAVEALMVTNGAILAAARLCGLDKSSFRRIVVRHHLEGLLVNHSSGAGVARGGNAAWRALE